MINYIYKRNGDRQIFNLDKIKNAIRKSFNYNQNNINYNELNLVINEILIEIEKDIYEGIKVEDIQDIVEKKLMQKGYYDIAKKYIIYRNERALKRESKLLKEISKENITYLNENNEKQKFIKSEFEEYLNKISFDLKGININNIINDVSKSIYNEISYKEIDSIIDNTIKNNIEYNPDYSYLASRINLNNLYKSILKCNLYDEEFEWRYKDKFKDYIKFAIDQNLLNRKIENIDFNKINKILIPKNDLKFRYMGIRILIDRYLIRNRQTKNIIELPQYLIMRVALGLNLDKEMNYDNLKDFYNIISNFNFIPSTPTLFNSGTIHSQMSSCYINTVEDSLKGIFKVFDDNSQLSKWAGGIGTDWTNVRSTNSDIKGTNGQSTGIIPFLKINNDIAIAVNQGGKRKGAMAVYLENWHLDIEEFIDLRKNTGDHRRRTHDLHTALWISDLFMNRVLNNEKWTLFSPYDCEDLHRLYGYEFEKKYIEYENNNTIKNKKVIKAVDLWKKIIITLHETGHPFLCFKDVCNIRNPQSHVGVINSSNLCTEITLNTSEKETAVCNLGSINLALIVEDNKINYDKLKKAVKIGIRILNKVIDNNFYPTVEAKTSNENNRPIGIGIMGYQDLLYQLKIPFESDENVALANKIMEFVSYYSIKESCELAKKNKPYKTFNNSKWDNINFPCDTVKNLSDYRNHFLNKADNPLNEEIKQTLNWGKLKKEVKEFGLRNSNMMAIAPNATISNIIGVNPCTEPIFKNIFSIQNLSGNFTITNPYLIKELTKHKLWNRNLLNEIKLNNGSIKNINKIPIAIKNLFKESFEINQDWIIKCASERGKWIDQSASTNFFINTNKGKEISDMYIKAWKYGLKTTYYLRTISQSQITKMIEKDDSDKENCKINNKEDCEVCQ